MQRHFAKFHAMMISSPCQNRRQVSQTVSPLFLKMKETMIMGTVRTKEYERVQGIYEPIESIIEYTYCDTCGSFNIGYSIQRFNGVLSVMIVASYVGVIVAALLLHRSATFCWGLGTLGLISFLIFGLRKHLKCNKCGNKNITSTNVLNYSGDDMSILDLPKEWVIKHVIETRIS